MLHLTSFEPYTTFCRRHHTCRDAKPTWTSQRHRPLSSSQIAAPLARLRKTTEDKARQGRDRACHTSQPTSDGLQTLLTSLDPSEINSSMTYKLDGMAPKGWALLFRIPNRWFSMVFHFHVSDLESIGVNIQEAPVSSLDWIFNCLETRSERALPPPRPRQYCCALREWELWNKYQPGDKATRTNRTLSTSSWNQEQEKFNLAEIGGGLSCSQNNVGLSRQLRSLLLFCCCILLYSCCGIFLLSPESGSAMSSQQFNRSHVRLSLVHSFWTYLNLFLLSCLSSLSQMHPSCDMAPKAEVRAPKAPPCRRSKQHLLLNPMSKIYCRRKMV